MTPSPDLAILRHLAAQPASTPAAIGIACRITAANVRACLAMLESQRLVASRQAPQSGPPTRVYSLTGEGRRVMSLRQATPANLHRSEGKEMPSS